MSKLSDELKRTHCPKCLGLLCEGGGSDGNGNGADYTYCEACDYFPMVKVYGTYTREALEYHVRTVVIPKANAVDRSLKKGCKTT